MPSQYIDQHKLFDAVVNEGIKVFGDAVKNYNSETFYAFCLCVDNDVTSVFPAANTHEGITRIQQGKYTFKWEPAEWDLNLGHNEKGFFEHSIFQSTNNLLYPSNEEGSEADEAFIKRKTETLNTLGRALAAIKESGVFDECSAENIVFYPCIMDADEYERDLMLKSVREYLKPEAIRELEEYYGLC